MSFYFSADLLRLTPDQNHQSLFDFEENAQKVAAVTELHLRNKTSAYKYRTRTRSFPCFGSFQVSLLPGFSYARTNTNPSNFLGQGEPRTPQISPSLPSRGSRRFKIARSVGSISELQATPPPSLPSSLADAPTQSWFSEKMEEERKKEPFVQLFPFYFGSRYAHPLRKQQKSTGVRRADGKQVCSGCRSCRSCPPDWWPVDPARERDGLCRQAPKRRISRRPLLSGTISWTLPTRRGTIYQIRYAGGGYAEGAPARLGSWCLLIRTGRLHRHTSALVLVQSPLRAWG